jgi:two-component system NtrC family sensor kinase
MERADRDTSLLTARERVEEATLFQAVIDAIPVSLYAIDRDFRVVVWNRGREAGPFGRPRGEVLGARLFDIVGEDPGLRGEFEEVFATGEAQVSEVEGRAEVPPRVFRVEKVPMRLGSRGDVTHVITFAQDVTERRALERSMAQAEKLAAVGRLSAGIAHEINNPLATIASCAESLRSRAHEEPGVPPEELAEDAAIVEEEAYRCKEIVESLLDFSRPASETREPCDLCEIAQRTLRLLRHNPKLASLQIDVRVGADLPRPTANPDHLVQALMALVVNAADASPDGRLGLSGEQGPDGSLRLSVTDDGPGIPATLQEKIFEPFFTTKPPGLGTGLGLSVVFGLIQAQGGRVEVDTQEGRGSRFTLVLPPPHARSGGDHPRDTGEELP